MAEQTWVTAARIVPTSGGRGGLLVLFWIWGLGGFGLNVISFTGLVGSVGVGTSAYMTVCMLLWIGGMVMLGLGAAALPAAYDFQRLETPSE